MSEPFTKEYAVDEFLSSIQNSVDYWASLKDKTEREKLKGLAFSILCLIDGVHGMFPALDIVVRSHPDDKQYAIDNALDYWPDGLVLNENVMLHDLLAKGAKE